MQGYVNQEGATITPEQMAEIEQRHERKQALLAENRADREAAYSQRHSHVGVEIGRNLAELALIAPTYHNLAAMANYCAMAGKDVAGRTLASLANGIMRAAVEMYGKDIEPRIINYEAILLEQARQDLGLSNQGSRDENFEPLGIEDDRTSEQLEADGDTHWPDGRPYLTRAEMTLLADSPESDAAKALILARGLSVSDVQMAISSVNIPEGMGANDEYPGLMGVTSQTLHDPDYDLATAIREGGLSSVDLDEQGSGDDEREPGSALREAVSPEPEDTPQRRAARLRREARKLAKQAEAEANATNQGDETSES